MADHALFPPIEAYETGMLAMDSRHTVYWEQSGNPKGQPALFLHGGPGSGSNPDQRRYFDPDHYRIVIMDQRGSGRSRALADITDNTTQHLIADIERLRRHLRIDRWLVFGGSWGSTLGLAYGQDHPECCTAFILRGIWLWRRSELEWWLHGTRTFFPENWRNFRDYIPQAERHDLLAAYHRRLTDPDPAVHMPAAPAWKNYQIHLNDLLPPKEAPLDEAPHTLAKSRIMAHYMVNGGFLEENQLIDRMDRIRDIPAAIVQGRYDMICPTINADELARAWPKADYTIIPDAGHVVANHAAYAAALVAAAERFKGVS